MEKSSSIDDEPQEEPSAATARPLTADELPKQGDRSLVVGMTGQGKTEFVIWLLERLPSSPVVIYDTKGEPKFDAMPRTTVAHTHAAMLAALQNPEFDYVVFRVPPEIIADSDELDALLWYHFRNLRGVDLYIDELYSFTANGRAERGLMALLTQGRSLGFTTVMSVQRPAGISLFPLTESQHFYIFFLAKKSDRVRMAEVIPNFEDEPPPPQYHFYYYRQGSRDPAQLMAPILLDRGSDSTYKPIDEPEAPDTPDAGTQINWI